MIGGYGLSPYIGGDRELAPDHFVANFNTSITGGTGSPADQLKLPFPASYEVHWGDGTVNNLNSHTYAGGAGVYTVEIFTPVTDFRFNNTGDCLKLVDMVSLGEGFEINATGTWSGCRNMVYSTDDIPIINTTNLSNTFQDCELLNVTNTLSGWDVSNVERMAFMFSNATAFNGDITGWDTGNIIDLAGMFLGASTFNQDIGGWDVSSVVSCGALFLNATSFNQDLNTWDTSNFFTLEFMFLGATSFNQDISGWNVASVTNFSSMFSNAWSFNQDISGWNVTSASNFSSMFSFAWSFNQDLTGWTFTNATNLTAMLDNCGMDTANYDAFLVNMNSQAATINSGLTLGAQGRTYTIGGAGETARTALGGSPALMSFVGDSGV